jgi:hypothetical protein
MAQCVRGSAGVPLDRRWETWGLSHEARLQPLSQAHGFDDFSLMRPHVFLDVQRIDRSETGSPGWLLSAGQLALQSYIRSSAWVLGWI